jgi:hypothetical protein
LCQRLSNPHGLHFLSDVPNPTFKAHSLHHRNGCYFSLSIFSAVSIWRQCASLKIRMLQLPNPLIDSKQIYAQYGTCSLQLSREISLRCNRGIRHQNNFPRLGEHFMELRSNLGFSRANILTREHFIYTSVNFPFFHKRLKHIDFVIYVPREAKCLLQPQFIPSLHHVTYTI